MTRAAPTTSQTLAHLDRLLATGDWPRDAEGDCRRICRIVQERARVELRARHPHRRAQWLANVERQAAIAMNETGARLTLSRMLTDQRAAWLRISRISLREEEQDQEP